MKRILYVTSKVFPWFESKNTAEHFRHAPYSIDAIGYNLEKLGWGVGWMGRATALSPFAVARRIDEFKPDIVYTYGSTVALKNRRPDIAWAYLKGTIAGMIGL